MSVTISFPEGFLWGAATAAYQIEGSPLADGAGPSNWHRFSHHPGNVVGGHTGDVACDHYRRYRDDVALMKDLGLKAYRFSISWSRILPEGRGAANAKGLDFYRRLVDELLDAGIQPVATLYHWDLPAALDDRGGWLNRDVAGWFADYASIMFRELDGRIRMWATLNEPWVVVDAGYLHGAHAPGHSSIFEAPIAANNILRAHGAAIQAYRADGGHHIGVVVNLEPKVPATDSAADREATARSNAYMNQQYLDPMLLGRYSEPLPEMFGEAWPDFPAQDLELIRQKIDFLGINYYKRGVMHHDDTILVERAAQTKVPTSEYTAMDWEIHAPALTDILIWVKERYGSFPIYITENGAAFDDPPQAVNGRIDDPRRVKYLREHITAVAEAIRRDVDVRGYFVWSLLDNYEWSAGYSKRFGVVHVNYETQDRTPKASARFYAQVIERNGLASEGS